MPHTPLQRILGIVLREIGPSSWIPVVGSPPPKRHRTTTSLSSQSRDIAAGVQKAVAKRIMSLVRRVGIVEKLTVTGGCAKNIGLMKSLASGLGLEVVRLKMDAQLVGALGAAVLAMRNG